MTECVTCGHPNLRPEGHAEWCERVTARLLAGIVCEHCGREFDRNATLANHALHCPAAASAADSEAVLNANESAAHGAPGPVVAEAIGQRPEHRLLVDAPAPQSKEAVARTTASITAG